MSKKDKNKTKKSKSRSGSNGETTSPDSISKIDSLTLQLTTVKKENNQLRRQNIELQKDLSKLRAQLVDVQAQHQLDIISKNEEVVASEWDEQLSSIQKDYGLDLSRDQINLKTGVITWAAKDDEVSVGDQNE